jgi:hypothetical protein
MIFIDEMMCELAGLTTSVQARPFPDGLETDQTWEVDG